MAGTTDNKHSQELYWREPIYRFASSEVPVQKVFVEKKSKFQDLKVVELDGFGRTLITDGFTQSSQIDEALYHEALCHPALLLHPNPRNVMVCGGGEGACLREILKHESVERLVMVDLDEELVNFSREHLPEWGQDSWKDPRVELHYEDARGYLKRCKKEYGQSFDVIIIDVCDPVNEVVKLYEKEFYEELKTNGALNEGFVIVQQCGPCSKVSANEVFTVIHNTMSKVFTNVIPLVVHLPSFFDLWGFNICFDSKQIENPRSRSAGAVDTDLRKRLGNKNWEDLKLYDGCAHQGLFGIPKWLKSSLQSEKRIITENTPIFMNSEYTEAVGKLVSKE